MLGLYLVFEIIVHSHPTKFLKQFSIYCYLIEYIYPYVYEGKSFTKNDEMIHQEKKQFENFRLSLTILGMTSSILVQKAQTNLLKHYFPFAFSFYETEYVQIKDAIIAIKKVLRLDIEYWLLLMLT